MRRREKEITELAVALDVLARGEVLHLAMIAEDGGPYLVPLSYVALPPSGGAPLRLLVHSAPAGRKIDALRADPRVCFEVTVDAALVPAEKACEIGMAFRSVIGSGRAVFLADPAAKARALSLLGSRYAGREAAVAPGDVRNVEVIEIRVETWSCKVSPAPRRG